MLRIIFEQKIFRIALIILGVGIILLILSGIQISATRASIQEAKSFAAAGHNVQANLEENLRLYQETYQEIIDGIHDIRPETDEAIIPFISSLENIGQKLALEITVRNLESDKEEIAAEPSQFIKYQITFSSDYETALAYLREIEKLPYMIKINNFSFKEPTEEDIATLNQKTTIILKLYTK